MTRKVKALDDILGERKVDINPKDAQALGIADGEIIRVTSRRGSVVAKANVTGVTLEGIVFMTSHFAENCAKILTNGALDPVAKTPEYKVCAVGIEKKSGAMIKVAV
jgi:anaerobic selenocysteine-containing dehydrogenase